MHNPHDPHRPNPHFAVWRGWRSGHYYAAKVLKNGQPSTVRENVTDDVVGLVGAVVWPLLDCLVSAESHLLSPEFLVKAKTGVTHAEIFTELESSAERFPKTGAKS